MKEIHSQRFYGSDEYIDTQIEFESINQQRLLDIDLCDQRFRRRDIIQCLGQKDAFALTTSIWFDNKYLII